MPQQSDVHIDRPLSNFAVKYKNNMLIANTLSPFVPVNFRSDDFITFTKKDRFTIPETIRGPNDYANEVDWTTSTDSYACVNHALRHFLSDKIVANSDNGIEPRKNTTELVTDLLLLDHEVDIATLTTTAGNYGGAYKTTLTGGNQWSAKATSDPMANVQTGKDACFVEPNTGVINPEVFNTLKAHPQILDRISGGNTQADPAIVTLELLAELFELETLVIGKAKRNTANKGQTATFSYIWGDFMVLAYVEKQPSLDGCCAWKTFRWKQATTNLGFKAKTYREEAKGGGGTWIETETDVANKAVCADVAYLISDTTA